MPARFPLAPESETAKWIELSKLNYHQKHEVMVAMFFVLTFLIAVILLPYWLISSDPFPEPSGLWKVSTSNLLWNIPSHSGIIAKVWYPSSTQEIGCSPYIDNTAQTLSAITTGLHPLSKLILNKLYLGRIQAPSSTYITPKQSQDGFPLILFSPGFGGVNFLNTFYALEFASHGFIVIGINHPG